MTTIITALEQEWTALVAESDSLVATWAQQCPELLDDVTLDDVLHSIRRSPDTVLAFLLARHQDGDTMAGRTVLQTMLPKVMTQARVGRRRGAEEPMDDLVSQMWLQIDRYPLDRRPTSIAANLAMDTLKYASVLWANGDSQWPTEPARLARLLDGPEEVEEVPVTAREVIDLAAKRELVNSRTLAMLRAVYCEGLTGAEAAARFGCSTNTVRFHCSKAVRRHLAPLGRELVAA